MTRRNFLKQSLGGGALLSLATPAVAQAATTLRLLSTDAASAAVLAEQISAATGDALKVETTLVPLAEASGMLDLVSKGEADMCLTPLDSFLAQNLAFGLFASMPFGMSTSELEGWIHASDGGDMLAMLGEEHGVSFHLSGDTGTKPIWSKEPLSDLADLQGKAVGSTGLGILNLQQIGVQNVVNMHDPSIDLTALDVLDGISVTEMTESGLAGSFTHITLANPNKPSGLMTLAVGNNTLDGLSEGHSVILKSACSAALTDGRARSFHNDAIVLVEQGAALSSSPLPDDIWQAMSDGAQTVLATVFEEGDIQATVVDAYVYFLTDIAGWSEIGEAAFVTGRKRLVNL